LHSSRQCRMFPLMGGRLPTRNTVIVGVLVTLMVLASAWLSSRQGVAQVPPSSQDCPAARQVQEFTETGNFTSEYFEAPTGQLYASYEFPNGATGIIYDLEVGFEREPPPAPSGGAETIAPIGSLGIIDDPPETEPNQGQSKLEDVPGRYRLELSPSDPDQEYVVTVYECDPSGGESTVPSPSPSPGGSTAPSPSPSPGPKTTTTPPKTPATPPKTPSPAPKTPAPAPKDSGTLMNAGGPTTGPMPLMPDGSCPGEFPTMKDGACYPA
jgi:hypothetical protein